MSGKDADENELRFDFASIDSAVGEINRQSHSDRSERKINVTKEAPNEDRNDQGDRYFDEQDRLEASQRRSFSSAEGLDKDELDHFARPHQEADYQLDPDRENGAKNSNKKMAAAIGGVILVGALVMGGIGYLGYKALGGTGANSALRASGDPAQAAAGSVGNSANQAVLAFESALGGSEKPSSELAPKVAATTAIKAEAQSNPLIVPFGNDKETQGGGSALSDEEQMYDKLLEKASSMDAPSEAIKIDDTVVKQRLEEQRITQLEQDVVETKRVMAEANKLIKDVQAQIGGITEIVAKNTQSQERLDRQISDLSAAIDKMGSSSPTSSEMKAIQATISRLESKASAAMKEAEQAKKLAAGSGNGASRPAERTEPRKSESVVRAPEPVKPAVQQVTATIPASTAPAAVVAPATAIPKSTLPAHCDGRAVSANWRVKGVNHNSAYIVRIQDNQGLLVKLGVDVPGYGQVQGFDPQSRGVCTTSGLIRR